MLVVQLFSTELYHKKNYKNRYALDFITLIELSQKTDTKHNVLRTKIITYAINVQF